MAKGYTWSNFKHHKHQLISLFVFGNTTITLSKVDTRKTSDKAVIWQSCILDVLLRNRNIMAGKSLNIFGESVTRCVCMSPQEKECTSSS